MLIDEPTTHRYLIETISNTMHLLQVSGQQHQALCQVDGKPVPWWPENCVGEDTVHPDQPMQPTWCEFIDIQLCQEEASILWCTCGSGVEKRCCARTSSSTRTWPQSTWIHLWWNQDNAQGHLHILYAVYISWAPFARFSPWDLQFSPVQPLINLNLHSHIQAAPILCTNKSHNDKIRLRMVSQIVFQ